MYLTNIFGFVLSQLFEMQCLRLYNASAVVANFGRRVKAHKSHTWYAHHNGATLFIQSRFLLYVGKMKKKA